MEIETPKNENETEALTQKATLEMNATVTEESSFNDEKMPKQGYDREKIFSEISDLKKDDFDFRSGKVMCLVYHLDHEHENFLKKVYNLYFEENYLNPTVFKSIKKIEEKILRQVKPLFNSPKDAVGSLTTGGTESILLAVKTYKEIGKKLKKIKKPNMIVSKSAHVAFEKAANYFDIKYKVIDMDDDFRVNQKKLLEAIDRNTIMVVLSAPQYPHGSIDPIFELGPQLEKKNIPLHVDGCVGGFILPWMEKLGNEIPHWDFRVPGVTSISADLHKYGYVAPKGASLLLYRSMNLMKYQFFVSTEWPGGVYVSPTIPGSRPGGAIATTYATLLSLGEEGYMNYTQQIIEAKNMLEEKIAEMPELFIFGKPLASCIAIGSSDKNCDIFAISDQMNELGWHFDRIQNPNGIHLTLMPNHLQVMDEFVNDLKVSIQKVQANPNLKFQGNAPMYGVLAKVPFRKMVKENVLKIVEEMYAAEPKAVDESSTRPNFFMRLFLRFFG
ncbi:aspartate aminotransferase family protein [Bacteriovoracaceae bacterium]|nr:aspartate aminotransferase family protein [Bacteriovoracaceae bacterium]